MKPDEVARYLCHRLPQATGLKLTGLSQFPRGVSRETWFVDATWRAEGEEKEGGFVFRRDLDGGSVDPTPLRYEFDVYRHLAGSRVPVAKAMWYEGAPEWLIDGRPFYVRERLEGDWSPAHFNDPDPKFDEVRIAAAKEHAQKLALVHTCDWRALGFGEFMDVPESAADCAGTAIRRWERIFAELQVEPFPVVTEALIWLKEHAPRNAPRVSLLKGNNGIGEEIWKDGRIVGLSDWELASLGDPASDWARVQQLNQVIIRPDGTRWDERSLLEYYEQVSGIHIDPGSVDYYRVFWAFESVIYSHNAALPLLQGTSRLARLAWVSTSVLHSMQRRVAAAAGITA